MEEQEDRSIVDSFAIRGYKSFGARFQRFAPLAKVNVLIGQNNSGKSNVLSFLHTVYSELSRNKEVRLDELDKHKPNSIGFAWGIAIALSENENGEIEDSLGVHKRLGPTSPHDSTREDFMDVLTRLAEIDGSDYAWIDFIDQNLRSIYIPKWIQAFKGLNQRGAQDIAHKLTTNSNGRLEDHLIPRIVENIVPAIQPIETTLIPAIRKIGQKGTQINGFGGEGIIDRLVQLQNPNVHNQGDRRKFEKINEFLRSVYGKHKCYNRNTA